MVGEWLNTSEIIDKNAKKPCHRLGWCPYGKLVEEFPIREEVNEFTCKVFHHDCPIFYHIEYTSEEYGQEDYENEIELLYKEGGLNQVFSKDKIAEYWYKIGTNHTINDCDMKIRYAIEKVIDEDPKYKEILQKLNKIYFSVSMEEIHQWDSQK